MEIWLRWYRGFRSASLGLALTWVLQGSAAVINVPAPPPGEQAKGNFELLWKNISGSVRELREFQLLNPGSGYQGAVGIGFVGNAVPPSDWVLGRLDSAPGGNGSIQSDTAQLFVMQPAGSTEPVPRYGNELTFVIDPPRRQDLADVMKQVEWGDEIQLQAGVYFHNFEFGKDSPAGLTIRGRGMGKTMISGGQLGSVIRTYGSASVQLVLEDLTLIDGLAENGGGIYNEWGDVTLRRCEIRNCRAYGPSGEGGGIYNAAAGHIKLIDCRVHHNAALRAGGGISNSGLSTSTMPLTPGVTGGAIAVVQGLFDALAAMSELDGKATTEKLEKVGRELVGVIGLVLNSLANLIPEGEEVGLGIKGLFEEHKGTLSWVDFWQRARSPVTELVRTRVYQNEVGQGIKESINVFEVTATHSSTGEVVLLKQLFPEDHRILAMGAGVHNALGYVKVEESRITENKSRSRLGSLGGGISSFFGMVTLRDSQVLENLTRATSVYASGGGLYSGVSWITAERCQFNDNKANVGIVKSSGGGISSKALSFVDLDECEIIGNVSGGGGGIANEFSSILTVQGSTIADNSISGIIAAFGGGISNESGGVLLVSDSTISGNRAVGLAKGGGVYNHVETGNSKYIRFSMARLHNSTISGNEVDGKGTAGIPLFALGGGIYNGAQDKGVALLQVHSCTIYDNRAHNGFPFGGGIYLSGLAGKNLKTPGLAQIDLGNSILANNTPDDGTYFISPILPVSHGWNLDSDGTMKIIMAASEALRSDGEFRTDADVLLAPLDFNGGPTKTHALLPGSPAIDRGEPGQLATEINAALFDQRGYERSLAGRRDIGAFESGEPFGAQDFYGGSGATVQLFENELFQEVAPGVLKNDFGDEQRAELVSGTFFGGVHLAEDGSFEYRPNKDFHGSDQFSYRVVDSRGRKSDPVLVGFEVAPVLDLLELSPDFTAPLTRANLEFRLRFDEPVEGTRALDHLSLTGSQSGPVPLLVREQVSGSEFIVALLRPLHPGEEVSLHLAASLVSDGGVPLVRGRLFRQQLLVTDPSETLVPGFLIDRDEANPRLMVDLDHDGDLDLVGPTRKGAVWLNQGDGTYRDAEQKLGTEDTGANLFPGEGTAVVAGDLNGDQHVDIVVIGSSQIKKPSVWLGDGLGHFHRDPGLSSLDAWGTDLALGDFNSDGFLDLFVTRSHSELGGSDNRVFLNLGGTGFAQVSQHLGFERSEAVGLADLNGDGHLDAFVGNGGVTETKWVRGEGGQPDTLVPVKYEANLVYLGRGNGRFVSTGQMLGDRKTESVALGDLDGNGSIDAVTGNGSDGIQIWLNDGLGNFSAGTVLTGEADAVLLGDFDADGDLDLVRTRSSGATRLWMNQGDGSFERGQRLATGGRWLAMGNADRDGDIDLLVSGGGEAQIFENAILPVAEDRGYEVNEDETLTVSVMDGLVGTGVSAAVTGVALGTEVYRDSLGGLWHRFGYDIETYYEGNWPNGSYVYERPSRPGHGQLELNSDGSFVYRPKPNFDGTDTFSYALKEGVVIGPEATVTIVVKPVLDPPTAEDDLYPRLSLNPETGQNTLVRTAAGGVLKNDRSIETGEMTASLVDEPMHGTVTLEEDGSFVYSSGATFELTDRFSYRAETLGVVSEPTVVRLGRYPIEARGELYDRDLSASFSVAASDGVLANDDDPNVDWIPGAVTRAELRQGPSKGTLDLAADGSFVYTPNTGAEGTDVFVYRARTKVPGRGFVQNSEEVRVKIGNTRPVAMPDGPYVSVGGKTIVVSAADGVLANDVDADEDPLVIAKVVTQPSKGSLSMASDGSFTYQPSAGASGGDFFEYRSKDPYRWAFKTRVSIELVNPLSIEQTVPGSHALVSAESDIQVVFNQEIASNSLEDRLFLDGSQSGRLSFNVTVSGKKVTLRPLESLLPGEVVSVTLRAGIRSTDVSGIAELESGRHWQFLVGGSRGGRERFTAVDIGDTPLAYLGHVIGDFNEDGLPDLLVSEYLSGPVLRLNQGDRSFIDRPLSLSYQTDEETFDWDPSAGTINPPARAGDFDGDGDLDLLVRGMGIVNNVYSASREMIAWNDGQGRFDGGQPLRNPQGIEPNLFSTGDFDADGDVDIMMLGSIGVWLLMNDGEGNFDYDPERTVALAVGKVSSLTFGAHSDFEVVDYDTDGDLDAIAMGLKGMAWLINDGSGRFTVGTSQLGDRGDGAYTFADFDQDGHLDVWKRQWEVTSGKLLYGVAPDTFAGGVRTWDPLRDLQVVDLDGDGQLDLWGYHGGIHRAYFRQGDGLYPRGGEWESAGTVGGVGFADFDGDGDLDVYSGEDQVGSRTPSADRIWFNESPPVAVSDYYPADGQNVVSRDKATGVLANDAPGDGVGLSVVLKEDPGHGNVVLHADGSFRYEPDGSFEGTDVFEYAARDSLGDSPRVRVKIGNTRAQAVRDRFELIVGKPQTIRAPGVLANDSDADGDPLEARLYEAPSHGRIELRADGSFTYWPDEGFVGTDTFRYRAHDGVQGSVARYVDLEVNRALELTGIEPVDHVEGIAINADLVLRFSAPLRASSVSGRVLLSGEYQGEYEITTEVDHNRLIIRSNSEFFSGETLRLTIFSGLCGVNDEILLLPMEKRFLVSSTTGNGSFTRSSQSLGQVETGAPYFAAGDMDQDGDVDILASYWSNGTEDGVVELWKNDGSGRFSVMNQTLPPRGGYSRSGDVELGDLDGDGDLDVLLSTGALWLNQGDGTLVSAPAAWPSGAKWLVGLVELGDLDGDGDLDILRSWGDSSAEDRSDWTNHLFTYRNDGAGRFELFDAGLTGLHTPSFDPIAIALGDLNGDDLPDLVVRQPFPSRVPGQETSVWFNDGDGQFSDSDIRIEPHNLIRTGKTGLRIADIDVDGDLDLLLPSDAESFVWLNDGNGEFVRTEQTFPGREIVEISLGDFDSDGDLDALALQSVEGAYSDVLLFNDGNGLFEVGSFQEPSRSVSRNLLADFDGRGSVDLLLGRWWAFDELWLNGSILAPLADLPSLALSDKETVQPFTGLSLDGAEKRFLVSKVIVENPEQGTFSEDSVQSAGMSETSTGIFQLTNQRMGSTENRLGRLVFVPSENRLLPGQTETVHLRLEITDENVTRATGRSLLVTSVNDAPVGADDSGSGFTTDQGKSFTTANVLSNDVDPDQGDSLTYLEMDTEGTVGQVIALGDGRFQYDPGAAFLWLPGGERATDSFRYVFQDQGGEVSSANVQITLNGWNNPPRANPDSVTTTEHAGAVLISSSLLTNDFDLDTGHTEALRIESLATSATKGEVLLLDSETVTYDPTEAFSNLLSGESAQDSFGYRIIDPQGKRSSVGTVTVTILGEADPPIAAADQLTFGEDDVARDVSAVLLSNDQDPDPGQQTSLRIVGVEPTEATRGALALSNGALTYSPNRAFEELPQGGQATDEFVYQIEDADGLTARGTVIVQIQGANDFPQAEPDLAIVIEGSGPTDLTPTVLANDLDIDEGDANTLRIVSVDSVASAGSATLEGNQLFYRPDADLELRGDDTVEDEIQYTIEDSGGLRSEETVSVLIVGANVAPVATSQDVTMAQNQSFEGTLEGTDADGGGLTFAPGRAPENGTLELLESGAFTYRPEKNFDGSDSFTFTVSDGEAVSEPGTVSIVVSPGADVVVSIKGRYLFYNRSAFDGNDPAANAADDGAVAVDKQALLPGQQATFDHISSYSRGLNGVMIDILDLPGEITLADFTFKVGNDNDTENWLDAPLPSGISRRHGEGADGSDRISLIWDDYDMIPARGLNEAVAGQWLQITLLANQRTCLAVPDVFYFGSAVGETGDGADDVRVTTADVLGILENPHSLLAPAGVTDAYDINRDRKVNPSDRLIARNHRTTLADELLLIDLTSGLAPARYAPFEEDALVDTGSPWQIRVGTTRDGMAAVSFRGPPGAGYEVYANSDLWSSNWVRLEAGIVETSPGKFQLQHQSLGGVALFYQIIPVVYESTDVFPER